MDMTGNKDRVEVITSVQRRRRWSAEEKVAASIAAIQEAQHRAWK